ncbi:NAD(P)H-dependent flavin oxidoreductase [Mycolicibacterium sediminis]|uniref:2-nitropropane dioxygenase n=1 Tax=Mycolicibacterium sediminis TaxID=1286180 RepID=A0A7I7QR91_9MYCO|nr:nitronate monooxygenase [Mycolicibacterium sediminis]BBY28550.1 2-nitropropane dioxygenase [Mycolicibacterium sediminis]
MALHTALTTLLGVDHPIVLAPMGGVSGGALAAAVSEGGGLGMIGSGDAEWLRRECDVADAGTEKPWGVGLLAWSVDAATLDEVIARRPAAIMLSFGDPTPFAAAVRASGIPLLVQVTTLDDARRALDLGADAVVAQGAEAGGHGEGRGTMAFVPAVVDAAGATPVVAAGGIADGRGVAAALALGAAGAMIGTRFEATHEALVGPLESKAIIAASAADTTRDRVLDVVRDSPWPHRFTARTLRNRFTDAWHDREDELRDDAAAKAEYAAGVERGDPDYHPVWAGEAVDLIREIEPATPLVGRIVDEAERVLRSVQPGP